MARAPATAGGWWQRLQRGDRRLEAALLGGITALALALRAGYVVAAGPRPLPYNSDPYYFQMIAEHLLQGRGFVEVNGLAYRPPGFPGLLAGLYAVLGVHLQAARLLLAGIGALHCALQWAWVRRLASPAVALLAALFTALDPQLVRYPQLLYSEVLYLALQAGALWLFLAALDERSLARAALAGLCAGLAALTREIGLVIPLAFALWAWRARLAPPTGRLCLAAGVATLLVIAPWTARNARVLGAFVPITTNTGINFYMGNNPRANGDFRWAVAEGVEWNHGGGELAAHREGLRQGWRYIREHPGRTVALWAVKFWILWRPPFYGFGGLSGVETLVRATWLLSYLALLALTVCGWRDTRALGPRARLPLWLIALPTLGHLLTYAGTRYRIPLTTLLVFYAAVGARRLLARVGGRKGVP